MTQQPEKKGKRTLQADEANVEALLINEIQLLLAEKRTSQSALRTGIAVFALPLTVLSFLIATSRYYDVFSVLHLLVPLMGLCAALVILGSYLVLRAITRIRKYDRHIAELKEENARIARIVD